MRYVCYALVGAALVGLDQWTKALVQGSMALGDTRPLLPGIVHLTYVRNTGAAFSLLSGQRWVLVAITVLCIALVLWLLLRAGLPRLGNWAMVVVLAGAVGNLIDRLARGFVVDMVEVEFMRFAVFNLADVCVVCGGIALCLCVLLSGWGRGEGGKPHASDG